MKPCTVNLSVPPSTKQRSVKKMLFDSAESQIGHLEVFLRIIVEAGQRADVAYRLDDDTVDEQAKGDGSQCR